MAATDVLEVVALLEAAGADVWLDGGWGVDAMLGEQTRSHADLDLAVPTSHADRAIGALQAHGFETTEVAGRHNLVLADPAGRRVDLHLADLDATRIDDRGIEVYGLDGLAYAVGAFEGRGTVGGRPVRCCTAEFLVRAHTGYEIDADDVRDVVALCERFAIPLPDQHARFLAGGAGGEADADGP